jgi:hypothetical protein
MSLNHFRPYPGIPFPLPLNFGTWNLESSTMTLFFSFLTVVAQLLKVS